MSGYVSTCVRLARQAHSYAVWCRQMAAQHPQSRDFYLARAKRNKADAKKHLADARRGRLAA